MTPREGMVAAACRKFCRLQAQEPDQLNLSCSSAAVRTVSMSSFQALVTASIGTRCKLKDAYCGEQTSLQRPSYHEAWPFKLAANLLAEN